MTMVTSSEMGPYNPSPHSLPEVGEKNPYRTPSPDTQEARERPWLDAYTPKNLYPTVYGGMKIDRDPEYQHMLIAIKPDGSLFGKFMQARDYKSAIDAYNIDGQQHEIKHTLRTTYASDKEARTRE